MEGNRNRHGNCARRLPLPKLFPLATYASRCQLNPFRNARASQESVYLLHRATIGWCLRFPYRDKSYCTVGLLDHINSDMWNVKFTYSPNVGRLSPFCSLSKRGSLESHSPTLHLLPIPGKFTVTAVRENSATFWTPK